MILSSFLTSLLNVGVKCLSIVLAFAILLFLILIHELGHYTFGKIFKFKINEFSIGFGKPIYSKIKKDGEKFSIRAIPLGGFCAFEGEDEEGNEHPQSFNNQKAWKRLLVLLGGVLFNFITTVIFSIFLLSVVGTGVPKIGAMTGANAEFIKVGDELVEINGEKPSFVNGGMQFILNEWDEKKPVTLVIKREGVEELITQEVFLQPFKDSLGDTYYALGITKYDYQKYSVGKAILYSVPYSFEMAYDCLELLFNLITGKLSIKYIGGPITTINAMSQSFEIGITDSLMSTLKNMLLLFPLLSVNLAVFNALPIPALDGARMVFVLIEWIRKKPINRELEAKIHFWGLVGLFGFVVIIEFLQFTVFR